MSKHNAIAPRGVEEPFDPLSELLLQGAKQLVHQAVDAELHELCCGSLSIAVHRVAMPRWCVTVTSRSAPFKPGLARLCLKGISTGDMSEALKVRVGEGAAGLSATTVSRLKQLG